jgi:hypothetical protein
MVSANWKLGRGLALFKPQTMGQPGLGVAPRLVAILLASCFALPSAQADGWQGGRSWGSTGGNYHSVNYHRGGYRGGGYRPGYNYRPGYSYRPAYSYHRPYSYGTGPTSTATAVPTSGTGAGTGAGKTEATGAIDPGVPVGTTGPQLTGPGGAPVPWVGG